MWLSPLRRAGAPFAARSIRNGRDAQGAKPVANVVSSRQARIPRLLSSGATTATEDAGAGPPRPSAYVSGPTTHFGYADVPVSKKEAKVREVFESVADSYDVMNDLMSAGLHRLWKDELLSATGIGAMARAVRRAAASGRRRSGEGGGTGRRLPPPSSSSSSPPPSLDVLDVAGGTGDVAFRLVDAAGCAERALSSGRGEVTVTVCDINAEMLRVGERRARERYGDALLDEAGALRFVRGDAQSLPFREETYDLYTIAFGLRNVTDVDMALKDAHRVLKPGGRYLCLEFSNVSNPALSALYDVYSFNVIPMIGELVAHDRVSYQYLVESIRKFCSQDELKERMEGAGFEDVTYSSMAGGVVALHSGWKPL